MDIKADIGSAESKTLAAFKASKLATDINCYLVLGCLLKKAPPEASTIYLGVYERTSVVLQRGQAMCSSRQLGRILDLSHQQVRTAIYKLEYFGFIKTEGHSYGTLFTINNYEPYEESAQERNQKHMKKQTRKASRQPKLPPMDAIPTRPVAPTLKRTILPPPTDPQEVIKAAAAIGYNMPPEKAAEFIAHYNKTALEDENGNPVWVTRNDQPIRNWKYLLTTWKNNHQSRRTLAGGKKTARQTGSRCVGSSNPADYGTFRTDGKR